MLAVMFLSVWIGIAAAVTGRGRWWVVGPLVVVCGLAALGELAALYWGAWLTPLGAISLGITAGWTESRRVNGVAIGVIVVNLVAYAFLGFGAYDPPSLDAGIRFALIAFGVYAIPAMLGAPSMISCAGPSAANSPSASSASRRAVRASRQRRRPSAAERPAAYAASLSALAASWPQAPSMSRPRFTRTVVRRP